MGGRSNRRALNFVQCRCDGIRLSSCARLAKPCSKLVRSLALRFVKPSQRHKASLGFLFYGRWQSAG